MEAVCYGTAHIMRYFKDVGFKPQEVYACGGAT
jgi:ribulose kinase